ncbi:MAG: MgtC/SapB family protein [Polaromonas sp.]|uniref:MgtC/SapB family protein n=1 Tax=Rhodoferax sp. TaxID=50421 RepID=UPI00272FA504|nr:MgtC/SapB family protein [Rhodoferax sp.]MDP1943032.1 MgtC/SapB family protein [Rhodoferax sp.]MDP3356417.1 MgtC/SapB family protein [Polaromonas sp.]MDP3752898.1 MgtC/SapB family protein [Polaromonas sp.]
MPIQLDSSTLLGLSVALGIGLLIGAERERRKGSGPTRGAAGIRTFAIIALLGAVAVLLGGTAVLVAVTLVVGALALASYVRTRENDPGMTTEVALLLTCLLGGLAMRHAVLAAGIGAALAALLAAKTRLHHFVSRVLTERELHDALLFSAAALIVLPLAPDRFMGPFDAVNPYDVTRLVVLVMAISALGYVATRALGPRYGLPLAGFAAGFISSTATIHAMGTRAAGSSTQADGAIAGAALSSVATIVQLAVVVAAVQPALLDALLWPLVFGGVAACAYSLLFFPRGTAAADKPHGPPENQDMGSAFNLKTAVSFAAVVSVVLVVSSALSDWLGARGTLLAAGVTGLADAHATAASVASLVQAGKLPLNAALWPIVAGLSTNSLMKAAVAFHAGGNAYAARIVPGLVLVIAAVWLGVWMG